MNPERIVTLRHALGWETRRCAAYLGVDHATWRQWEAGKRAPSKANAAGLLALMRLTETEQGRASLTTWADDADRRRNSRRAKRRNQPAL